jgi:hypothetical protein
VTGSEGFTALLATATAHQAICPMGPLPSAKGSVMATPSQPSMANLSARHRHRQQSGVTVTVAFHSVSPGTQHAFNTIC